MSAYTDYLKETLEIEGAQPSEATKEQKAVVEKLIKAARNGQSPSWLVVATAKEGLEAHEAAELVAEALLLLQER